MDEAFEPLVEAFCEPAFEDNFDAAVFLVSPFSAFSALFASLAALDAETGIV